MDREHWARIKPLLDHALELEPGERAAWLAEFEAESPALARELQVLLASDIPGTGDLLGEGSLAELLEPTGSWIGRSVGRYVLERQIGQGGMGSVWLARRSDGRFEAEVAVKLLNLALLGRAGRERFAHEGRVLARLSHPNIARLIDAGVTDDGRPFLVLEHVVGRRIDRFVDEERYSPQQRIELFLEVLDAVAGAHANLVIHRDLKPSNILVREDGRPRLLDFGIAKLLTEGRDAGHPSTVTELAGRALTPEYAAPEQILDEPVSTATDVYSLGVLLYVLLAGRHPTGEGCLTPADHIRAVLDTSPPRLSDAVTGSRSDSRAAREQIAAARRITPERLRRLYLGDLDNILAKALKKQPAERYPTVIELRDDLVRFLNHQPVRARPDSWAYRTRKFARRNRVAVAAALLTLLSLLGGSSFSLRQMLIAREQRNVAEAALARREASVAFESLLFRLLEPGGAPLTYRQLLDRGREALERQYRGEPVTRIQLRFQFAQNYMREGDYPTARQILAEAARIADSLQAPRWQGEARCELAVTYTEEGRADSAAALLADARRRLARARDLDRGVRNACDDAEAETLLLQDRPDSAARLFGGIAERFRTSGDTVHENYVFALNDQARAFFRGRRIREAQQVALRLADLARDGAVADPGSLPVFVYNVATSFSSLGELRSQREFLARELRSAPAAQPAGDVHGLVAYSYGSALLRLEQLDSAALWLGRAADRATDVFPRERIVLYRSLARLAERQGLQAEAERHEAQARDLLPGTRTFPRVRSLAAMDRIRMADGRFDREEVKRVVEAALDSSGYTPRETNLAYVEPLLASAEVLTRSGAYDEAARYAAEAGRIATLDSLTLTRSAWVGEALLRQAQAEVGRRNPARGRDLVHRAIAPLEYGLGAGHPLFVAALALRDSLR